MSDSGSGCVARWEIRKGWAHDGNTPPDYVPNRSNEADVFFPSGTTYPISLAMAPGGTVTITEKTKTVCHNGACPNTPCDVLIDLDLKISDCFTLDDATNNVGPALPFSISAQPDHHLMITPWPNGYGIGNSDASVSGDFSALPPESGDASGDTRYRVKLRVQRCGGRAAISLRLVKPDGTPTTDALFPGWHYRLTITAECDDCVTGSGPA